MVSVSRGRRTLLDFGSGWGENTRRIAKRLNQGGRVTALDVSKQWQEVLQKKVVGMKNVDLINADIRNAGLPGSSYDVIVIDHVLHDIPRSERSVIVNEIVKTLRTHGFLQLCEPTRPRHGISIDEIRALMTEHGLTEASPRTEKNMFSARYYKRE